MNTRLWLLLGILFLFACKSPVYQSAVPDTIIYQDKDKEILEQVLELYAADKAASTSDLMIKVGSFFLETPYVAHTLESEEKEHLVVNLRELDCTTFAENCLAISRTIKSGTATFEQFCSELQGIRYRDGNIDGYPSRLHYFCDWIHNNHQKNLIKDKSQELAQTSLQKEINFMSTHAESYRQLKDSTLVEIISGQEKLISTREMFYIPENKIAVVESKLMDGDIAGITTEIDGIAIQHVVLLIRKEGRVHLLHASSKAEKVVISDHTLEEYLLNSKSANGIMLARPL